MAHELGYMEPLHLLWYHLCMSTRAFTMRLPTELYEEIRKRQERGITAYVVEAVKERIRQERNDELARSLAVLAEDDSHIDYALFEAGQREAMKHVGD